MYNNLLRQRHVYYPDPILRFSLVVTYNGNQVKIMCHEHPDPIHIISAIMYQQKSSPQPALDPLV